MKDGGWVNWKEGRREEAAVASMTAWPPTRGCCSVLHRSSPTEREASFSLVTEETEAQRGTQLGLRLKFGPIVCPPRGMCESAGCE